MIEYRTNKERLTTTVAELNAQVETGTHPAWLTNLFIETTTPQTFSALYYELVPSLREAVVRFAKTNAASFDEVITWAREKGLYADGWVGFRDWARAQPWFQDALVKAEEIESREVSHDVAPERELAFLEAELTTAKTEREREDIQHSIDALRGDIARRKLDG